MLRLATKVAFNVGFCVAVLWVGSRDYCLMKSAPQLSSLNFGMLVLGLSTQILSLVAIYGLVNGKRAYFRVVHSYISNSQLKAVCFAAPFLFLLVSHDPIAYAAYNVDLSNKIRNAHNTDAALEQCCALCIFGPR